MKRNAEGAIVLTDDETQALANYAAGVALSDPESLYGWEDLPELSTDGYEKVADAMRAIGYRLMEPHGAEVWGQVR